jgi:hypothetical protein
MQAFTDFALTLMLPPNPVRALDNSLTTAEQNGRNFYLGPRKSDGIDAPNLGFNCNGCHGLNAGLGFFGADTTFSFEAETQIAKVPHLRNAYTKVGMFGMPNVAFTQAGDNGHKGDQIRGFGYLHDGSIDTIFRFFRSNVFNNIGAVGFDGPNGGDDKRREMERFMLAFDNDIAPIVGQQITLDSGNGGVVGSRIDLLIQRAGAAFVSKELGGNVTECDLIVKGNIAGEARGWVLDTGSGNFISDKAADAPIGDGALRALAGVAGQELTYTCVPPGSGFRMGVDRDEDTLLDGDDNCPSVGNPSQRDGDNDGLGDFCDPDAAALVCSVKPLANLACKLAAPGAQGKSQFQIKDGSPDSKDKLKWKWNKGVAVALGEFGSPDTSSSDMAVCIYDSRGLHRQLIVPTGGVVPDCAGKPCWAPAGTTGFKYKDRGTNVDGVTGVKFKAGPTGKAKLSIVGKGAALLPPETTDLSAVVVQLVINDGIDTTCFKNGFGDAGIKKQDAENYKVKGP